MPAAGALEVLSSSVIARCTGRESSATLRRSAGPGHSGVLDALIGAKSPTISSASTAC